MLLALDLSGNSHLNRISLRVSVKGLTTAIDGEVVTSPYGLFHDSVTVLEVKVVEGKETTTPLVEGEDYVLGPYDKEFYSETNQLGYNSIVLMNSQLSPKLILWANYVGGKYQTISPVILPEIINKALITKRLVTWGDFINLPTEDKAKEHEHSLGAFNRGYGNLAQSIWRYLKNKQDVGPLFIQNVASDALSTKQPIYDADLSTDIKTIPGALTELIELLSTRSDTTGEEIVINTILEDGGIPVVEGEGNQYFLVGGLNGEDLTINGQWENGDVSRVVPFGSLVVYNGATYDIIPSGFADRMAWGNRTFFGLYRTVTEALNVLAEASSFKIEVVDRIIDQFTNTVGYVWEEGQYLVMNTSVEPVSQIMVTGPWFAMGMDTAFPLSPGTIIEYSSAAGLTFSSTLPDIRLRRLANPVIELDRYYYLPNLVASFEPATEGDLNSGDIVTVVSGTAITDPELIPMTGGSVVQEDYPGLHAVIGGNYGSDDNTFGVPHGPASLATKNSIIPSSPINVRPQFKSTGGYYGHVDVQNNTLTFSPFSLTTRALETSIVEDLTPFDDTETFIGVGRSGTRLYLTGTVNSERYVWYLDNTDGVSSGFIQITSLQPSDLVVYNPYVDKVYILTASELFRVDDFTKVLIGLPAYNDTLLDYDFDPWGEYLYLLSNTTVYKLSLINGTVTSVTGEYTAIEFHWTQGHLWAINESGASHILHSDSLSVIMNNESINVSFEPSIYQLVSLVDDDTSYLSEVSQVPFYEYYIKG